VGATLGQQLFAIINSTVVTPYPVFQPPCQGPLYVGLIEELNKNLPPEWPSVSDLRTDVYPQPGLYVLNTVSSIVSNLPQPNLPAGCQPTDWLDVRTQILTELDYLQDLYDFQIAFQVGTLAVAEAMTSSFDTAVNTINNNSSNGSMAILGILSDIVEMAEVFQAASAVSTILGSYLAILSSIPGSSGVTGQLDQLQTQLKLMIDNANTAAGDVYAPICADWGKLQDFIQLLPSLEAQAQQTDYNTIGNLYEISVYQAVLPSIMAIVYYQGENWGSCADPSNTSQALAVIPGQTALGQYNGVLCSRLTGVPPNGLGVSMTDICSRSAGWSGLNYWWCAQSDPSAYWSCTNETPQIESNVVTVTGSMIVGLSYVTGSLQVTPGQSYSSDVTVALEAESTQWAITALANRQGSSDIATAFVKAVGGSGYAFSPSSSSTRTPGKLNLYFAVLLTLSTSQGTTTVGPVYLGQGHTFLSNNWWIGGEAVTYDNGSATLSAGGARFSISGGVSSFLLMPTS
jgi:hypothetical protein